MTKTKDFKVGNEEELQRLLGRVRKAQQEFSSYPQEKVDEIKDTVDSIIDIPASSVELSFTTDAIGNFIAYSRQRN